MFGVFNTGDIPLQVNIRETCDSGQPVVISQPQSDAVSLVHCDLKTNKQKPQKTPHSSSHSHPSKKKVDGDCFFLLLFENKYVPECN